MLFLSTMIVITLFIIGLISRIIPHAPNFVPIVAIALFSGAYLDKKYSLWLALGLYVISDLIIGLHQVVIFTWTSVFIITLIGIALNKRKSPGRTLAYTLLSSVLFFIVTNFGVWASGWYPKTLQGLTQCYIAALPFFRTSLLSNLAYVTVLFGVYEFFTYRLKSKSLKTALLLS
ncbi:MAG: hypothetical protein JW734_00075 [Candidatus Omnitrophica bacterium]|nr:hypothetical protein [Candidatus Omnitrophota bacterium]